MKRVAIIILGTALLLASGCDPAMTIRQARPVARASTGSMGSPVISSEITIDVESMHPLIGVSLYAPTVKITNSSELRIVVTRIELATLSRIYQNEPLNHEICPVEVLQGRTEVLPVSFYLDKDVKETFYKRPAGLRVHYRRGDKDETASASIIGGPLDLKTPPAGTH